MLKEIEEALGEAISEASTNSSGKTEIRQALANSAQERSTVVSVKLDSNSSALSWVLLCSEFSLAPPRRNKACQRLRSVLLFPLNFISFGWVAILMGSDMLYFNPNFKFKEASLFIGSIFASCLYYYVQIKSIELIYSILEHHRWF